MADLPFSDDELLSSYLDGELTDTARAGIDQRLADDADLRARLEALRAAALLAGSAVSPIGDTDRDRLVRVALEAAGGATVSDIERARHRTVVRRARFAAVAAAVAALVIAVPLLQDQRSTTTDETADSPADAELESLEAADDAGTDGGDATMSDPALDRTGQRDGEDGDDTGDAEGALVDEAADAEPTEEAFMADEVLSSLAGPESGFDPLPDDLGEFTDLDAAWNAVRDAWDAVELSAGELEVEGSVPGTTNAEVLRERASSYLDRFGGCGAAIDTIATTAFSAPPVAIDYTETVIGGIPFTFALLRLADESGALIVIDTGSCAVIGSEELDRP